VKVASPQMVGEYVLTNPNRVVIVAAFRLHNALIGDQAPARNGRTRRSGAPRSEAIAYSLPG
jgi:hypothetical protein